MTAADRLTNRQAELADVVRAELDRYRRSSVEAMRSYLDAASALLEARDGAKHGQWGPFLEAAGVEERTAQNMVTLAKSSLKPETVSGLGGVRAALAFLRTVDRIDEARRCVHERLGLPALPDELPDWLSVHDWLSVEGALVPEWLPWTLSAAAFNSRWDGTNPFAGVPEALDRCNPVTCADALDGDHAFASAAMSVQTEGLAFMLKMPKNELATFVDDDFSIVNWIARHGEVSYRNHVTGLMFMHEQRIASVAPLIAKLLRDAERAGAA